MKRLYLGLRPPPGTIHYPVIRVKLIRGEELRFAKTQWHSFSHLLVTSQTTVHFLVQEGFLLRGKEVVAIGSASRRALLQYVSSLPQTPQEATQEGLLALLSRLITPSLLFPHSQQGRPLLTQFLARDKRPHFAFALYRTELHIPATPPLLTEFREIIFTSPSTVQGFLAIFGTLPTHCALTAIGPITKRALEEARIRGVASGRMGGSTEFAEDGDDGTA